MRAALVSGTAPGAMLGTMLGAMLLAGAVRAQTAAPAPGADEGEMIVVTGSRIKRNPNDSPLPLQVFTPDDLSRESIVSPEQFISLLSTNGNGADNLASNTDVTSGAQRGTNGLSAANLRGQGSAATLVLLNGRRVAAHGLSGQAVDVNQIPFAAIERIEVLKDGASAIYGTDAVGGVINFITKTNYQGVTLNGFTDVTGKGDSPIYRISGTVGYGDLKSQGFNIMGAVSYSWNSILRGSDRSFVNGNQPNRGLSVDTRGTPIATLFPVNPTAPGVGISQGGTLLGGTSGSTVLDDLIFPGSISAANPKGVRASGGINVLDLPGGAGCQSMDGGMAYDDKLWANPAAAFACAWDTGRAAILQQPLETLTYYGRATVELGEHQLFAEITGSKADSSKQFSNNQLTANNTTLPLAYPLNDLTRATYNDIYNKVVAQFPAISVNYGKPIAFRWRCIACDVREYATETKTLRATVGAEGPLFGDWDYRAGASYARSESSSVLGTGYHFRGTFVSAAQAAASGIPGAIAGSPDPRAPTAPGASAPGLVGLINSGILNPFSLVQSQQAIDGLKAISATGTTLYGGKYEVKQADASVSGSLFELPAGSVKAAIGVDFRQEKYGFNGSPADAIDKPNIFNAAFDNVNALTGVKRDIKAAYAEVLFPIFTGFEITGAIRVDDYTGFGTTWNPKVAFKWRPIDSLLFRGSYNSSFRVPSFNQIFNGVTLSPYSGRDLVDPVKCPSNKVSVTDPNCFQINPDIANGGFPELGPEKAKQVNLGVVFQPNRLWSASVDWWMINVDGTITILTLQDLVKNATLFPERFVRNSAGTIIVIDQRWVNAGARRTQGLEISLRGGHEFDDGSAITAGLDGTYLLKKREQLIPNTPFGPSLIGVFTFAGDLGLRWKHNAWVTWSNEQFSVSLSQIFRKGYTNQELPGVTAGLVSPPDLQKQVKDYVIYNLSASATIQKNLKVIFGVRNLFDKDPPFAITYDSNTGAGSSWEPRVADPRGRSFTLSAEVKF